MEPRTRRNVHVTGRVQGVGFRPWAARLARSLELAGTVCNASDGVRIAIEGEPRALDAFLSALRNAPPPAAGVERIEVASETPRGERGFAITASCDADASRSPGRLRVPLDAPVCEACLAELFDPQARRYRYPFTHCASCGPRAAVLEALPYDRARTSLRRFPLCVSCRHEYEDPADRRHHAEAIACPTCGPTLRACSPDGSRMPGDPIESAVAVLRAGGIVAMKGSGGFHLVADATNQDRRAAAAQAQGTPDEAVRAARSRSRCGAQARGARAGRRGAARERRATGRRRRAPRRGRRRDPASPTPWRRASRIWA